MAELGTLNQTDPGAVMRSLMSGVTQQENNADLMSEKQIDNLYHISNSLIGHGMSNEPTYSGIGALGRVATTFMGLQQQNRGQAGAYGLVHATTDNAYGGNADNSDAEEPDSTNSGTAPNADTGASSQPHDDENHPALKFGNSNVSMDEAKAGIHTVESSDSRDPYQAVGPVVKTGSYAGDHAYGKYQVMGKDIPQRTEAAGLGRMTVADFVANPDAQEKQFEHEFGGYLNTYGNFNDAASKWFTGRTLKEALAANKGQGANDGYTNVRNYIAKANGGIARYRLAQGQNPQGSDLAYANPSGGGQPANPLSGPVNNPVSPQPAPPAQPGLTPQNLAAAAPPPPTAAPPGTVPPLNPNTVTSAVRPPAANVKKRFGIMAPPTAAQAVMPLKAPPLAQQGAPSGFLGSPAGQGIPTPQPRPAGMGPGAAAAPPPAGQAAPPAQAAPAPLRPFQNNPVTPSGPAPQQVAQAAPPNAGQAGPPQPSNYGDFIPPARGAQKPSRRSVEAMLLGGPHQQEMGMQLLQAMTPHPIQGPDGRTYFGTMYDGFHATGMQGPPQTIEAVAGADMHIGPFKIGAGSHYTLERGADGKMRLVIPEGAGSTPSGPEPTPPPPSTGGRYNAKGFPIHEDGSIDNQRLQKGDVKRQ